MPLKGSCRLACIRGSLAFTVAGVAGSVTENSMVAKKFPGGMAPSSPCWLLDAMGLPNSLGVHMAAEAAASSAVNTGVKGTWS